MAGVSFTDDRDVQTPNFDELYRRDQDPWRVQSSWYERRKLAVLMAALPRERYAMVWEPGCGPGFLSSVLAQRADELIASDFSSVAIEQARERCDGLDNVRCVVSELPAVPTHRLADLIVVAEFLYYVKDLEAALDSLWSTLAPGGNLVFMHWAHHPEDAFRSGRAMHVGIALDASTRDAPRLVSHIDNDFMLDVYEAPA